jgi:glycosyltransferase 2 family protein
MPDSPAGAPAGTSAGADGRVDGQGGTGGEQPAQAGQARPSVLASLLRLAGSRPVRWVFVAVTVGVGGYAVVSGWPHVQAGLSRLGPAAIIGGLICVLAALLATMQVYRVLLAALGSPLPARTAAQILFVGQLGKYLPGSVWPVLAQMQLGAAHKVPRTRSASASVLTMLMSLVSGILVGLLMLPFAGHDTPYRWVFVLAPVIAVCMHPKVLNRILDWMLRLARRPPLERPLTGRAVATGLAWGLVSWIFFGLQIWLLGRHLGLSDTSGLLLAIGSFAFAWCAGFVIIFAPAGAGIREIVLIALLAGTIGRGNATAVALVSRVLMTLGDLISAGTAAWFARRLRPARTAPDGDSG